jgi:NADH-quinone oxidoreductase subunit A
MLADYVPILILLLLASGLAGLVLVIGLLTGPRRPTSVKLAPYESGMTPVGRAQRRMPIQYYLIATLFILFDIEVIFLYPWAVAYRQLKLLGLIEMGVFLLILFVGYFYLWKKGALEWQ